MKALVIGATGATGKDLVEVLLNDPAYNEIVLFVRRSIGIVHAKLKELLIDFDHPDDLINSARITGIFLCDR